ncbi:MAG: hypothetical protein KDE26_27270, partial [Bacteroidetes bacterium]|nr:hypothetical protein [Bacteroidota bacterium]
DELMSLISDVPLEKIVKNHYSKHAKQLEISFFRALGFISRQLKGEWKYLKKGAKAPIPPSPENTTLRFRLSVEQTRKLTLAAGRKKLSLNSLISAVMTREVIQRLHLEEKPTLGRAICFADLRTIMPHSPPASALGCYTSMIRMDIPLRPNQDIWEMAENVKRGIFQSNRRGDIQVMTKLSKYLFRMAISMKKMRLGNTALSFIGKLDLKPMYGSVELNDVNAFITNNQFGPELSAFGKIFRGQLGLDFTYLSSELEDAKAREIVMNIQETLEKIANLDEDKEYIRLENKKGKRNDT